MEASRRIETQLSEELYPPHDPLHGTADEMVRRVVELVLPEGTSRWEQTDYGHPGRFNEWEPRGIDSRLQPKATKLKAAVEAIGALLD